MPDKVQTAIFVVLAVLILVTGGVVFHEIDQSVKANPEGEPQLSVDGVSDRADDVYGEGNWSYASTGIGWDMCCMQTAVNNSTVQTAMFRALYRDGGWVPESELTAETPLDAWIRNDPRVSSFGKHQWVETRTEERTLGPDRTYYRYVGPEDPPFRTAPLTDAERKQRIDQVLYVYGGWMTVHQVADSAPGDKTDVRFALAELEERGELQKKSKFLGPTYYAQPSVDHPVPSSSGMFGLWKVAGLVLIAALVIVVIQRVRPSGSANAF